MFLLEKETYVSAEDAVTKTPTSRAFLRSFCVEREQILADSVLFHSVTRTFTRIPLLLAGNAYNGSHKSVDRLMEISLPRNTKSSVFC